MDRWQPLVKEDSKEPIIVMCPQGGELHCYRDGTVVCTEGSKMWGFKLPPGVALWHDTSMPVAVAERMSREKIVHALGTLRVVEVIALFHRHGFYWDQSIDRHGKYGSRWIRGHEIITILVDGNSVQVVEDE